MASLPPRPASNRISRPDSANVASTPRAKSRLESLPAELMLQIVGKVDHEDIQNFAHCCKMVWENVKEDFEVHQRRRKYYTVRLGAFRDNLESSNRPIEFLRDLIEDDGLAKYPERLVIGDLPIQKLSSGEYDFLDPPFLEKQENKIRDIIQKCRYGEPSDVWDNAIMKSKHPNHVTSLIVSLLPNLRVLELRNYSRDRYLGVMMRKIICASRLNRTTIEPSSEEPGKRSEDEWDPEIPHALSNLTEFNICLDQGGFQDFGGIIRWALLPSLRSVRLKGLHSFKDRRRLTQGHFAIPGHRSEITNLELEECMLRKEDFETLLKSIKALKTFKYHFGMPENPLQSYRLRYEVEAWDPRGLVEILSTYASHSLVSLNLTRTGNPTTIYKTGLDQPDFVGSLRRFRLLRKLRADIMIFIDYPTGYVPTSREDDLDEFLPLPLQARPLVDLLPVSLEKLTLCLTHKKGKWDIEDLFKEAQRLKAPRLPSLTTIVIEGEREPFLISDKTIQIWKNCGVQIYRQIPFTVS